MSEYFLLLKIMCAKPGVGQFVSLWPYKQFNKQLTCTNLRSRYGDADFCIDRFHYFTLKTIIV